MTLTPQSPTVWLVTSSRTLICSMPGCHYSAAVTKKRVAGSQCPTCGGKLEAAVYLVDLEAYNQTGACSCHRYRCHIEPLVKAQTAAERRLDRGRCRHIEACRKAAKEDDHFDALLAMLPQQEQET
jgi:hypothetical protein